MLDKRLSKVAEMVPVEYSVADIGTDHGYLAVALYQKNNQRTVIAADKNLGPCEAARKTMAEQGLKDRLSIRQGDGLRVLSPGEIDIVCIAGMGGKLIANILQDSPEVFALLRGAVLQPQNAGEELRRWLYEKKWHIEKESLVKAEGRIYQIIYACPGKANLPSELELLLGPVILRERGELFIEYVKEHLRSLKKILAGREKSVKMNFNNDDLIARIRALEEMLL